MIYYGLDRFRGNSLSAPKLLAEHEIVSCVSVLTIVGKHVIGVLCVYSNKSRDFTSYYANFLQSVGHIIAAVIERTDMQIKI